MWDGKENIYSEIVASSHLHGLNPKKYWIKDDHDKIQKEILLTDRLLSVAKDVSLGRLNQNDVFPTWNCKPKNGEVLEKFLNVVNINKPEDFYTLFSPSYYQYGLLVNKLSEYDSLARSFNQKSVKIKKPLKLGDKDEALPYIKEYLFKVGDLKSLGSIVTDIFDEDLQRAVRSFQVRHGLTPDGVIGRRTIEEINYPLTERLKDIAVNLEKIRLLDTHLSLNRIEINVPSYTLDTYINNKLSFTMKVIVGRGDEDDFRPTFIHCGKINNIVFNPYWWTPRKIAVKDILPKIRKNPNFLTKNDFKVFLEGRELIPSSINWYSINENNFNFRLVQLPGEKNALGKVKIEFENPFDIYLHDTPYKELFEKDKRDLSSGCIRLENAKLLVNNILLQDGYGEESIENLFNESKTIQLKIKSNFMVYIFYLTALVKDDKIYFYKDIYRYDKILKDKLFPR